MIKRLLWRLPWPLHEAGYRLTGWVLEASIVGVDLETGRPLRELRWVHGIPAWVQKP